MSIEIRIIRRWRGACAIFAAMGAAMAGLNAEPAAAKGKLRIVATTPDLASVAREMGGDRVEVSSIATGGQNLHTIAAKPSFMMKARKADLWIRVGLQLEAGYERPILQGSRNRKILVGTPGHLDASAGVSPLEVPGGVRASVGLTLGDVHPMGNPHYWLDPFNIRIVARNIARRLSTLDAAHSAEYRANFDRFVLRIDESMFGPRLVAEFGGAELWRLLDANELDAKLAVAGAPALGGWLGSMRPLRGSKVVTYHRSWPYFFERFGLDAVMEVEPKPGIPPSPGHVVDVIERMKAENVKIILMEPFYSRKAPDRIARDTGAKVVVAALSVTGQKEANDYFGLIDNLITRLVAAAPSSE